MDAQPPFIPRMQQEFPSTAADDVFGGQLLPGRGVSEPAEAPVRPPDRDGPSWG